MRVIRSRSGSARYRLSAWRISPEIERSCYAADSSRAERIDCETNAEA